MSKIQEFIQQHLLFLIKIFSLSIGIIYLYFKLSASIGTLNLSFKGISSITFLKIAMILLVLSGFNWYGELQKWKGLACLKSLSETVRQVFIGHALSICTPNKLGEYGGKCMLYSKDKSHQIIALTGIGHLCQLISTVLFGIIGLINLPRLQIFEFDTLKIISLICLILSIGILCTHKRIRAHLHLIANRLKNVSQKVFLNTLLWSILRYLCFSHQFLFLLWGLDIPISYFEGLSVIFTTYFLSSVIPSFAISDVFIKGSVAVSLFSLYGVQSNLILTIVFFMWIFNTMLPALLGYVLLLQWKPKVKYQKND